MTIQVPTLLQASTLQLTKALTRQQSRVEKYLPRNLKDIVRTNWLRQSHSNDQLDCSHLLPCLLHDQVGELDLSDYSLNNLSFLLKCPSLTKLDLKNALTPELEVDYNSIFSNLIHLRVLYLHFNQKLKNGIIFAFAKYCTRLRELDLEHCSSMTDEGFIQLKNLKCLHCVNFAYTNITDIAISEIFSKAGVKNVKELRLDHCKHITDDSIDIILEEQGSRLDIFIMHACPLVTSKSMIAYEHFHNIKQVSWTIY